MTYLAIIAAVVVLVALYRCHRRRLQLENKHIIAAINAAERYLADKE